MTGNGKGSTYSKRPPQLFFRFPWRGYICGQNKFLKIDCSTIVSVKNSKQVVDNHSGIFFWQNLEVHVVKVDFSKYTRWTFFQKASVPFPKEINVNIVKIDNWNIGWIKSIEQLFFNVLTKSTSSILTNNIFLILI